MPRELSDIIRQAKEAERVHRQRGERGMADMAELVLRLAVVVAEGKEGEGFW